MARDGLNVSESVNWDNELGIESLSLVWKASTRYAR